VTVGSLMFFVLFVSDELGTKFSMSHDLRSNHCLAEHNLQKCGKQNCKKKIKQNRKDLSRTEIMKTTYKQKRLIIIIIILFFYYYWKYCFRAWPLTGRASGSPLRFCNR
jgi:hypothetical protein